MLSVIGVGYPRTGTMSLKLALEHLGFGPCYHMIEVFERPDDVALWHQAIAGDPDWQRLLGDFRSTSDAPGCYFWRDLIAEFPAAKVILTVRDADTWYESFLATVFKVISEAAGSSDEQHQAVQEMAGEVILKLMLDDSFEDRQKAIEIYEQHNRMVEQAIDPSRLLVFHVEDGWQPLCDFLETDVPPEPFPHINTRREFRERLMSAQPKS